MRWLCEDICTYRLRDRLVKQLYLTKFQVYYDENVYECSTVVQLQVFVDKIPVDCHGDFNTGSEVATCAN